MNKDSKDFVDILWRFFSSLKLTLFLLIGLAVVSIIGTLIQQNAGTDFYVEKFGAGLTKLFTALNFVDMYHSRWYVLLLLLLAMNIIACSLRRLPHDWKTVTSPKTVLDDALEKTLSCRYAWKASGTAKELEPKAEDLLRKEFTSPLVTRTGNDVHLFARKWRFSRLGVYVLHSGIIIILTGAMVGYLFSYRATVSIEEGKGTSVAYTSHRNFYQSFLEWLGRNSGAETIVSPDGETHQIAIDLGFTVLCNKFSISFYDNGTPKEYKSILSIVDKGETVVSNRPVIVNDPLSYRGVSFYQSSYNPSAFLFTLKDRETGATRQITVKPRERTLLPNGDLIIVMDYTEEIRAQDPHFSGPAVYVAVRTKTGKVDAFVLLRKYPDFSSDKGGNYQITYGGVSTWSTGLQVSRDPGSWIVWAGCILLVGGIFISFFLPHQRIWVRISDGHIVIAGSAGKNQAAFKRFFDDLSEKLKKT